MIFKQRYARLFNGKKVKEKDHVFFINSDGKKCDMLIMRRPYNVTHETGKILRKGSLYFWNICYEITDYRNADLL